MVNEDKIFKLIIKEEEFNWKSILLNIIKADNMDPWNIDISYIAKKYMQVLKQMKELNLSISGKVILASALLLKIKSKQLLNSDINSFDSLFENEDSYDYDEYFEEAPINLDDIIKQERNSLVETPKLLPRTPQPRERKVSIFELMNALNRLIESRKKRINYTKKLMRREPIKLKKNRDMSKVIIKVYKQILNLFKKSRKITLSQLVREKTKKEKVYDYISLLYLYNQRRLDIFQKKPFGDINIKPVFKR